MKKLQIECFDSEANLFEKFIAEKIDATIQQTIISKSYKESDTIRWPQEIDHWNIIEGMITIYYKNGCYIEITRVK